MSTTEVREIDPGDVQVIDQGNQMIAALSKAEIDQQVATARRFERSISAFRKDVIEMCTLTEQVARECIYAVPRKEDGRTKMIEGPSARLAEIVANAWGNCRAGARVVDESAEFITAQGVFHDLQKNVAITFEVRRRITTRNGARYSADMIATTGNAACSIALRNAVFKGVPKAYWSEAYNRAREVIAGDSKTFAKRREEVLDTAKKLGVPPERIFAALNVEGASDIGVDELVQLQGLVNAVREGEIKVDEAFPDPNEAERKAKAGMAGLKERVAGATPPPSEPEAKLADDAKSSITDETLWQDFMTKVEEARIAYNGERHFVKKVPGNPKVPGKYFTADTQAFGPDLGDSLKLYDSETKTLTVTREQLADLTSKLAAVTKD